MLYISPFKQKTEDYIMTEEQVKILDETPTTQMDDADTTTEKKRPGPINPIQVAAFVTATTSSIDKFVTTMYNYEPYTLQSCYETLIDEYYQELIKIEDYFKDADKTLVLDLVDDKTCKIIHVETQKDSEDRKRCPDQHISMPNLMTGSAALTRLAALPNFEKIDRDDRAKVCNLFDSLSTTHAAIANIAGNLATLGRRLDPTQFQFLLKHSVWPLVQLQVPARLCNPADLTFAKASLADKEMFEQRAVNNMLPRPHHPDLEAVDPKHSTRTLAPAIHYQIRKKMFTKFPASQTEIANLFQVERKKFFTSITGCEYEGGKKMTKKKVKTSDTKEAKESTSPTQTDPDMPPLEDKDALMRPKQFKFKKPIPTKKHHQKK